MSLLTYLLFHTVLNCEAQLSVEKGQHVQIVMYCIIDMYKLSDKDALGQQDRVGYVC